MEASRDEQVSLAKVVDAEGRRIARHHRLLGIVDKERWGLALSGGGIRSATFCLGVVEWLIQERRIRDFDYLSTVSGGGYIGSWRLECFTVKTSVINTTASGARPYENTMPLFIITRCKKQMKSPTTVIKREMKM